MALAYGEKLAKAGVQVISGMAKGIDGAGQRGALNGGGKTYGILGCGVDVCYPREHIGLYMDLSGKWRPDIGAKSGQPPLPYFQAEPDHQRPVGCSSYNRSKRKKRLLDYRGYGLGTGKDVYALPGPVTSPASQGCHRLIKQGAGILLSPEDLLMELEISNVNPGQSLTKIKKCLKVLKIWCIVVSVCSPRALANY